MTIRYSEATLKRVLWLDQACVALLDYRDPGATITANERDGLAGYLDYPDLDPATAAELYQAATNP